MDAIKEETTQRALITIEKEDDNCLVNCKESKLLTPGLKTPRVPKGWAPKNWQKREEWFQTADTQDHLDPQNVQDANYKYK